MALYVMVVMAVAAVVYFCDIRTSKTTVDTLGLADYSLSFQSIPEFFKGLGEGTMNLFSRWFTEKPRYMKKLGIVFMVLG
ncbi:MAG: hypothetical protein WCN92_11400, partial [Eubacteriales bacterium]